jgi:hypothetical protein
MSIMKHTTQPFDATTELKAMKEIRNKKNGKACEQDLVTHGQHQYRIERISGVKIYALEDETMAGILLAKMRGRPRIIYEARMDNRVVRTTSTTKVAKLINKEMEKREKDRLGRKPETIEPEKIDQTTENSNRILPKTPAINPTNRAAAYEVEANGTETTSTPRAQSTDTAENENVETNKADGKITRQDEETGKEDALKSAECETEPTMTDISTQSRPATEALGAGDGKEPLTVNRPEEADGGAEEAAAQQEDEDPDAWLENGSYGPNPFA